MSWGDITIFELDQSVVSSNSLVFAHSCARDIGRGAALMLTLFNR